MELYTVETSPFCPCRCGYKVVDDGFDFPLIEFMGCFLIEDEIFPGRGSDGWLAGYG